MWGPPRGTGIGYHAAPNLDRIPEYDPRSGNHFWIVPVAFKVDPGNFDPSTSVNLDHENLVLIAGVGCFHCEAAYSPRLLHRRCPGEPK